MTRVEYETKKKELQQRMKAIKKEAHEAILKLIQQEMQLNGEWHNEGEED